MDEEELRKALASAYVLLCEFYEVINDQLEGDHPCANEVDRWCNAYERMNRK